MADLEKELADATAKLTEFRNSNRALNSLKTELEQKVKDTEGVRDAALADVEKLQADVKKFEGVDLAEYAALKGKPDLAPQLARERFTHAVSMKALQHRVRPAVLDFAITEAGKTFALNPDGSLATAVFSSTTPGEKLGLDEWLEQQYVTNAWMFESSKGGGANGGGGVPAPKPTVDGSDPLEVGRNLENIAAGRVTVI